MGVTSSLRLRFRVPADGVEGVKEGAILRIVSSSDRPLTAAETNGLRRMRGVCSEMDGDGASE